MATKLDKEVGSDEKMLSTKSHKPSIKGEGGGDTSGHMKNEKSFISPFPQDLWPPNLASGSLWLGATN